MVKIIEEGKRRITRCERCQCKFSYEEEDIEVKYVFRHFTDIVPEIRGVVECPCCKSNKVIY